MSSIVFQFGELKYALDSQSAASLHEAQMMCGRWHKQGFTLRKLKLAYCISQNTIDLFA